MQRDDRFKLLVTTSHALETFDGRKLINLGDGILFDRNTHNLVGLQAVLSSIRRVYNSNGRIIAKRKHWDSEITLVPPRNIG